MLPRGNWIRHYYYDFPALLGGGIDLLHAYGLHRLSEMRGALLALDRFVLAAHSGGGMPAIDAIAGADRPPDELFVFDGGKSGIEATTSHSSTKRAWSNATTRFDGAFIFAPNHNMMI